MIQKPTAYLTLSSVAAHRCSLYARQVWIGSAVYIDIGLWKLMQQHMQEIGSLFRFSVACGNLANEFKSVITTLR